MLQHNIAFTHPEDLPDDMPVNPNCGKSKNGFTFRPPHRELTLSEQVEKASFEEVLCHGKLIRTLGRGLTI